MRRITTTLAIALLAALSVPAAGQNQTTVSAQVACSEDGRPIAVRVIVPGPGVVTVELPPDVCSTPATPPAAAPAPRRPPPPPAASSSGRSI